MNYIAHIFLSGRDSQVQIGNFIGDFVKGSQFNDFPERIRKGIILHRKIDHFTDHHPVVTDTKAFIRPVFGRYSGIILDMYFDYFMAKNFNEYSMGKSLKFFAFKFYIAAVFNYKYLPTRVKGFIFHFITTNRLEKYSTLEGLKRSLEIMANHKVSAIKPNETIEFLIQNSVELEKQFKLFFPDLIEFVDKQLI